MSDLVARVASWLAKEGYPLEFRVAEAFRKVGFVVFRGDYVRDSEHQAPREIDVTAFHTVHVEDSLLRIYQVIECKYSLDKPWVVFTPQALMAPSAVIAQTLGSAAGRALLWARAGDEKLKKLHLFCPPGATGFGGRQAFSGGNDVFHATLQAVVTKSTLLAGRYDEHRHKAGDLIEAAVVAFPLIVVDGTVLEAHYDIDTGEVALTEQPVMRLHWRGASAWRHHATIDIVSINALDAFAALRFDETRALSDALAPTLRQLHVCLARRSLEPLDITPGPRGFLGAPALLRDLVPRTAAARPAPDRPAGA